MRILTAVILLSLAGCSTVVPVEQKWPEAPSSAMVPCPQLGKLDENAKLSDVAKTVTGNYTAYYECSVKTDAWIEWYNTQKQIRK